MHIWFQNKSMIVLWMSNLLEVYVWESHRTSYKLESHQRSGLPSDSQTWFTNKDLVVRGIRLIFCPSDLSLAPFPSDYFINSSRKYHLSKNGKIFKASRAIVIGPPLLCLIWFLFLGFPFPTIFWSNRLWGFKFNSSSVF